MAGDEAGDEEAGSTGPSCTAAVATAEAVDEKAMRSLRGWDEGGTRRASPASSGAATITPSGCCPSGLGVSALALIAAT